MARPAGTTRSTPASPAQKNHISARADIRASHGPRARRKAGPSLCSTWTPGRSRGRAGVRPYSVDEPTPTSASGTAFRAMSRRSSAWSRWRRSSTGASAAPALHSQVVARYAELTARELDLPEEVVRGRAPRRAAARRRQVGRRRCDRLQAGIADRRRVDGDALPPRARRRPARRRRAGRDPGVDPLPPRAPGRHRAIRAGSRGTRSRSRRASWPWRTPTRR